MQPFTVHTGMVAPLDRPNVDTDQICPAQFLKRIERTGFGQFLFHSWRFLSDGHPNPDFVLNFPPYQRATVPVAQRKQSHAATDGDPEITEIRIQPGVVDGWISPVRVGQGLQDRIAGRGAAG